MNELNDSNSQAQSNNSLPRKIRHALLLILGPAAIVTAGFWFYLQGGRYVATDNAYIKADILTISSNISGQVTSLAVHDSEHVNKGDLLFRVDDQPYRIALARAEANLANVRSDIESLREEFANKNLEIDSAKTDLAFQQREMTRLQRLITEGSISESQYDSAVYARDAAERNLAEKRQGLKVVQARLVDPTAPTDEHPRVRAALAELEKAKFDLNHVEVFAPTDGIIVNVSTHPGENVITGGAVMSLISDERIWLEANFKETDLTYMSTGQNAEISVDTYPDRIWHGHVAAITPATGAEFSLLPPQNSSGNWVKVVQRVTVRLELDDYPGDPYLASGMSANVEVDTGHQRTLPFLAGHQSPPR